MKITIIGGGLAGCSLAYIFRQLGLKSVLYEAGPTLAGGASGNFAGLYNPRLSVLRGPESHLYASAFVMALRLFPKFDDIDLSLTGILHLLDDERKDRRLRQTVPNWSWPSDHMRLVTKGEASDIAGIPLDHDALYLPTGGSIAPQKLCARYVDGTEYHLNTPIEDLDDIDADIKILACGPAVQKFAPELPIIPVRGQISQLEASTTSSNLQCSLCYHGYILPAVEGIHTLGATFLPNSDNAEIDEMDDLENTQRLGMAIPALKECTNVIGQRASVRATSRDRFPVIGKAPGKDNVYVSAAHGSYGILSTLAGAHLLASMILDRPRALPKQVIKTLDPARFEKRAKAKEG
ncbi:MAG: FAD-dependent 5-carboxymethylaminomethyl-2-thiouridine(34) oxidoreductase MnmC [Sneathiella sp.]|nr:FAD-dependent 5-carboxymethylaminomethyl-2-thiouridine(34) oxidoreductase MnmC [Sneathiella sp.]